MKYGVRVYERNSCVACDTPAPVPTNSSTRQVKIIVSASSNHAREIPADSGGEEEGRNAEAHLH